MIVDSNVKKYLFLYLSIDEVQSTNMDSFESTSMKMKNFGMLFYSYEKAKMEHRKGS